MSNNVPVVQNFVHGRFLANTSGETFPVVNPATGQVTVSYTHLTLPTKRIV